MLCHSEQSQLILIDIQQRLADAMHNQLRDRAIHNSSTLARAAGLLNIPTVVTRQYPQGLGDLVPQLQQSLTNTMPRIDKTSFSCCGTEPFTQIVDEQCKQIIIAGMETHVCVLQTAHELLEQGYRVFVVEDAVCSRQESNHHNAIQRMRQAGIVVSNTESVLFEWLRDAKHKHFKTLSAMIK